MRRRHALRLLAGVSALAAAPALAFRGASGGPAAPPWDKLKRRLGPRLTRVVSPLELCAKTGGRGAEALFAQLKNPYYLGDEPALTQTLGWVGAWTSSASDYVVHAESATDVAAAVNFAREHGIRLVVKGGGHSYFGNSNAAGSLLVWTRRMKRVVLHDAFEAPEDSVPAASIGAGAIWGDVYRQVAAEGGRYVQGGGCLTVGVAGFVQGGGFGSFSKTFGTGAANLLEAEVVTADGRIRTVNAKRDPELFFALRGGGGGTFAVVTRVTLKTHALPSNIGAILFSVEAADDVAWRALVERVLIFYAEHLLVPEWGEQLSFRPGRRLSVSMLCHGLNEAAIRNLWQPLLSWLRERPTDYRLPSEPFILAVPGRQFWNPEFLRSLEGVVLHDERAGAPANNLYWATNRGEAGQVLHAYQSAWLPSKLLQLSHRVRLVDALVSASAEWPVGIHTNKGLAGGSPTALDATLQTATNPEVTEAFALLICAAEGDPAWPGIPGHEPKLDVAEREAAAVARAMVSFRQLVPLAGCYMSEADYFDQDWRRAYWGENYPRLIAAKRRYDPTGFFRGHHCVGS